MSTERFIGTIRTGTDEDGSAHHTIDASVQITKAEYDDISAAAAEVLESSRGLLYQLVYANHQAIHEEVRRMEGALVGERGFDWSLAAVNAQLALANWLSAVRWLLDHTVARLSGEKDRLARVNVAMSAEFDEHFEYRLCYKLRDFATHRDLPPLSLTARARLIAGDQRKADLTLQLKPAELLAAWDGWGRFVTEDLQSSPEPIELVPFVDDAMQCIERVMQAILAEDAARYVRAANLVIEATKKLSEGALDEEAMPILFTLNIENGQPQGMTPMPLPIEESHELLDLLTTRD